MDLTLNFADGSQPLNVTGAQLHKKPKKQPASIQGPAQEFPETVGEKFSRALGYLSDSSNIPRPDDIIAQIAGKKTDDEVADKYDELGRDSKQHKQAKRDTAAGSRRGSDVAIGMPKGSVSSKNGTNYGGKKSEGRKMADAALDELHEANNKRIASLASKERLPTGSSKETKDVLGHIVESPSTTKSKGALLSDASVLADSQRRRELTNIADAAEASSDLLKEAEAAKSSASTPKDKYKAGEHARRAKVHVRHKAEEDAKPQGTSAKDAGWRLIDGKLVPIEKDYNLNSWKDLPADGANRINYGEFTLGGASDNKVDVAMKLASRGGSRTLKGGIPQPFDLHYVDPDTGKIVNKTIKDPVTLRKMLTEGINGHMVNLVPDDSMTKREKGILDNIVASGNYDFSQLLGRQSPVPTQVPTLDVIGDDGKVKQLYNGAAWAALKNHSFPLAAHYFYKQEPVLDAQGKPKKGPNGRELMRNVKDKFGLPIVDNVKKGAIYYTPMIDTAPVAGWNMNHMVYYDPAKQEMLDKIASGDEDALDAFGKEYLDTIYPAAAEDVPKGGFDTAAIYNASPSLAARSARYDGSDNGPIDYNAALLRRINKADSYTDKKRAIEEIMERAKADPKAKEYIETVEQMLSDPKYAAQAASELDGGFIVNDDDDVLYGDDALDYLAGKRLEKDLSDLRELYGYDMSLDPYKQIQLYKKGRYLGQNDIGQHIFRDDGRVFSKRINKYTDGDGNTFYAIVGSNNRGSKSHNEGTGGKSTENIRARNAAGHAKEVAQQKLLEQENALRQADIEANGANNMRLGDTLDTITLFGKQYPATRQMMLKRHAKQTADNLIPRNKGLQPDDDLNAPRRNALKQWLAALEPANNIVQERAGSVMVPRIINFIAENPDDWAARNKKIEQLFNEYYADAVSRRNIADVLSSLR